MKVISLGTLPNNRLDLESSGGGKKKKINTKTP